MSISDKKGEYQMSTIGDIARYVRSKNAGPFVLTIDLFCDAQEQYEQLKSSQAVQAEAIAQVYHVAPDLVRIFYLPDLNVIKITLPRPHIQGERYENDMHAGQQYVRILDLQV